MLIYLKDNNLNFPRIINFDERWKIYVDVNDDDGFELVFSEFDTEPLFAVQGFEEIEELNKFMDKLALILGALDFEQFDPNAATILGGGTIFTTCSQKKYCTCS